MTSPTKEELDALFCWEADDQIPSRPAMTAFRREARYRQARWRQANEHPIGTQPIVPKPGDARARHVGTRLPLDYARDACARYRSMLADEASFATMTLEQLLDSGTLAGPAVSELRGRYLLE